MQREFKLIKLYPDCSLQLGDVLIFDEYSKEIKVREDGSNYEYFYSLENCILFTEFWKEVIEKEWQILQGTPKDIKAIVRTSDQQIFRIGDHIQLEHWNEANCILSKITLYSTFFKFTVTQNNSKQAYFLEYQEDWRVVKSILETNDGVSLYQGDSFWHVDPYFGIAKGVLVSGSIIPLKGYKHFSMKERAEKYVDIYKPVYSKDDFILALKSVGELNIGWIIYALDKQKK